MNIGTPEVRTAIKMGFDTREKLMQHFRCSRSEISKPIYSLTSTGEIVEDGGRLQFTRTRKPVEPIQEPESYPSKTEAEKIDSMAVSGPAKGMDGEGLMLAIADAIKSYVSGLVAERDELAARVEELERKLAAVREAVAVIGNRTTC